MTGEEKGSNLTLLCNLNPPNWCLTEANNYGVHLSLLDEGGKELKNNRNVKKRCMIRHTVVLTDANPIHTQWRCQLIAEGQIQTTATFTMVKG